MPIKHDIEESQLQNEIFADILTDQPLLVIGDQFQRFEQVILIIGEILNKKYINEEKTGLKIAQFLKKAAVDPSLSQTFKTIFDNKLSAESKERIQQAINL